MPAGGLHNSKVCTNSGSPVDHPQARRGHRPGLSTCRLSRRANNEKAQRQLHRLTRRATLLLREPATATLAAAAKGMGLPDLQHHQQAEAAAAAAAAATPGNKKKGKRAAEAAAAAGAAAEAERTLAEPGTAAAVMAAASDAALHGLQDAEAAALLPLLVGSKYAPQLPRLTRRFAEVAGTAVMAEAAAAGAAAVDDLAGEAADRALALKADVAKGAKARKKKALTGVARRGACGASRRAREHQLVNAAAGWSRRGSWRRPGAGAPGPHMPSLVPADFFRALAAAGVSRRRTAVPASQRGSQAWFAQPAADPAQLLEAAGSGQAAFPVGAAQAAAAARLWAKADRYYFSSMARLQRLWEVGADRAGTTPPAACRGPGWSTSCLQPALPSGLPGCWRCAPYTRAQRPEAHAPPSPPPVQAAKQPHGDLSGAEVEGAVRSVEHLLWLTQRSRAVLGELSSLHNQLGALHAALSSLPPAGEGEAQALPAQERCRSWYNRQRATLAALLQQAEETAELLGAAAAAETSATSRRHLQAGAQQAGAAAAAVRECSSRLAAASEGAVSLRAADGSSCGSTALFLPAAVLSALQANAGALKALQQRLEATQAEQQQDGAQPEVLPGWAALLAAVTSAASESVAANTGPALATQPGAGLAGQRRQLAEQVEAAVAAALVWAQNAQPPAAPAGAEQQDQQEAEQQPLPELLQQLEGQLGLRRVAELQAHVAAALAALAAVSDEAPAPDTAEAAIAAAGLAPMLGLLLSALRQLGLQYLAVHKAAAKLCYISASLFAGLAQEGFCMPEGTQGGRAGSRGPGLAVLPCRRGSLPSCLPLISPVRVLGLCCSARTPAPTPVSPAGEAEEDGEGKVTEGTGLGEGDTTGAKDISNEVGASRRADTVGRLAGNPGGPPDTQGGAWGGI